MKITKDFDYIQSGSFCPNKVQSVTTTSEQGIQWADADNAFGAKYYIYNMSSGTAPEYIWYDNLDRQIVYQSYGLKGSQSKVFTQYQSDGKTARVSDPTFGSSHDTWDAVFTYMPDGRIESIQTPI